MRKNKRWTIEEKLEAVLKYLDGSSSKTTIAKQVGCHPTVIGKWVSAYRQDGIQGLEKKRTKENYTPTFKKKLINEVQNGLTQVEVMHKYNLSSSSLLALWIKEYTSGIKPSSKGRYFMDKGRKTTFEERLEIVRYAFENQKDYQLAADKYQVSYQQVYGWVRKYELDGQDGLIDRRGQKSKPSKKMSDFERLEEALKTEQRNSRRLQIENDYLKKLNEIEKNLEDYR